ncbi:ribosomal RNA small subunit methyltransferase E [Clostridium acetireducens DSM 10703]|uniref:Ribosomal RNA small subunit methyltransferase E n=1 Tax=Clostridium acetireducens DSM 10703 TaxID=1121290 RepID=A0A1E8F171_9CLOT|nr:16S rRNA (uracil(1498)-N(3))-methyltransferase [Clostridium acetireducens]OFI07188.1 ribosomal RNA small subunit methyltransferase E [Clostridium acetireducens DSM 10703]
MNKFFINKENIIENKAFIEGDDVKHAYKVLRLKPGENVSINNCEGSEFLGKIEEINKKQVVVKILEKLPINNESNIDIYLYQGLPKLNKMDLIVQKSTELGVKKITPIVTKRVVVKNEKGEFKKVDRWNKIALESCKQCKRSIIPTINYPMDFQNIIEELKEVDIIVVPYENQTGYGIKNMFNELNKKDINKVAIIIGPEGGFEEEEIQILKNLEAYIVTLGPRIFRTETAGVIAASLIMYEIGDIGGIY